MKNLSKVNLIENKKVISLKDLKLKLKRMNRYPRTKFVNELIRKDKL